MIRRMFGAMMAGGQVTEVRTFRARDLSRGSKWRPATTSGYFDDVEALIREVKRIDAEAIYFVPNPVVPDLLARSKNRMEWNVRDTTTDEMIVHRYWLLIDIDAAESHKLKITGTDAEHDAAIEMAHTIRWDLGEAGWPDPVLADSGNGAHLLYRVDLPNDDDSRTLMSLCLHALSHRYDNDVTEVDRKTFNAARIWKLYGTMTRKGDEIDGRPHRMATILEAPDQPDPVPIDRLQELAAGAPGEPKRNERPPALRAVHSRFDINDWMAQRLPDAKPKDGWSNGRRWILPVCPFNAEHNRGEAFVMEMTSGALSAGCHHNSCVWGWHELRDKLEPDRHIGAPVDREYMQRVGGGGDEPPHPAGDEPTPTGEGYDVSTAGHTDTRAAERLVKAHGHRVRHIGEWKKWLIWAGTHWREDRVNEVREMARVQAFNWTQANLPVSEEDKEGKKKYAKAISLESGAHIASAVQLASSHPRCAWTADSLDKEIWLLPTKSGIVNLTTGTIEPSSPSHRFTACAPVEYDPDATCPLWDRCLYEWMDGREDLIRFLQRWTGYNLTGSVREHSMVVSIGPGRNGKGVYSETIMAILGPKLAGPMAPGLLTATRQERHPTELFDLRGKRFVIGSEMKDGARFDEERVKSLTGGDTIKARRMREDFTSFTPTHKIMLACNKLPSVRDTSPGFWARFRVLPWDVSFVGREDRQLKQKLKKERRGILAWAVRGAGEWFREGLGEPAVVNERTQQYRMQEDQIARFVETERERLDHIEVNYVRFKEWCEQEGERPLSARAMAADLRNRGWSRRKSHGKMVWTPDAQGGVMDLFGVSTRDSHA